MLSTLGGSLDATVNKRGPHHLCHRIHIVVKQRMLNQKQIECWGFKFIKALAGLKMFTTCLFIISYYVSL